MQSLYNDYIYEDYDYSDSPLWNEAYCILSKEWEKTRKGRIYLRLKEEHEHFKNAIQSLELERQNYIDQYIDEVVESLKEEEMKRFRPYDYYGLSPKMFL